MSHIDQKLAARLLRAEMVRRDLSYADLAERLAAQGHATTEASLRNKVSRGTFSADFLIHCMTAMDVPVLRLTE